MANLWEPYENTIWTHGNPAKIPQDFYSVMQSDENSFYGNVVSDSFNNTSRDEDNILEQIYYSKYVRTIINMILIVYKIILKF